MFFPGWLGVGVKIENQNLSFFGQPLRILIVPNFLRIVCS